MKPASSKQYTHQVVQNSSRTTLPLTDSLLNFSPSSVRALNRGAGSLVFGPANAESAVTHNRARTVPRNRLGRVIICDGYYRLCYSPVNYFVGGLSPRALCEFPL